MAFRYSLIFSVLFILGCQSPTIYESTARNYEDCKRMLSDKSHPVWNQPEWIQEIETGTCEQLILEAEFDAATSEKEDSNTKDSAQ